MQVKPKARPSRRARERIRMNRKRERRVQKAMGKVVDTPVNVPAKPTEPILGNRTVIDEGFRWFVVQTFPGYEKRVSTWLRSQKVEHYLPADRVVRVRRGRTHTMIRYALPRHLFIGVEKLGGKSARDLVRDVNGRNIDGVYDILRLYGRDVEVRAADLQVFADTLTLDIEARITPMANGLRNGDQVLIISGPFASFTAIVTGPAPDEKVQAEVSIFGRSTRVDLGVDQFEAA